MKNYLRKIFFVVFVFVVLGIGPVPSANAQWTNPDFGGAAFGASMENILVFIKEVIWGAMKQGVIQAVGKEVASNIGGGSGGPKFITDWRDTLKTQPESVSRVQVKNFFTKMGGGKNSNYVSADGSTSGAGSIISNAQNSVLDMSIPQLINLAEYGADDPAHVFNEGNMRAFLSAYGSSGNKVGNQAEANLLGQKLKQEYDETNKDIARAQAIAFGGYSPTMSNGQVVAPGSTIRDLMGKAQGMPFDSLANAKSITEVVSAIIARVASNTVSNGIGEAKKAVQKKTGVSVSGSDVNSAYQAYTSSTTTSYGNINDDGWGGVE